MTSSRFVHKFYFEKIAFWQNIATFYRNVIRINKSSKFAVKCMYMFHFMIELCNVVLNFLCITVQDIATI